MDWKWFEEEEKKIKETRVKWQEEFDKVCQITFKARELEKTDSYKAIELYESIKNTKYGNFDTLGRLIILYRKTKQREKEIEHIEFKIEDLLHSEYNRMIFLQQKYSEEKEKIRNCYDNREIYVTPDLIKIDFYSKIDKLKERLSKLKSKYYEEDNFIIRNGYVIFIFTFLLKK